MNYQDWEDITQRAFLNIWKHRESYNGDRPLKPWIKVCVNNTYLKFIDDNVFYNTVSTEHANAKESVQHASPILTTTVELDGYGNIEIRYEPDSVEPEATDSYTEFEETLTDEEKIAFSAMTTAIKKRTEKVSAVMKSLGKKEFTARKIIDEIFKKYNTFLNGETGVNFVAIEINRNGMVKAS
jgi:DNA-directed RNA polymerase specialized sigma24 family protein